MLQAKTKLQNDSDRQAEKSKIGPGAGKDSLSTIGLADQKFANARPTEQRKASESLFSAPQVVKSQDAQTRIPVIIGEATYRGMIRVDGIVCGQPGTNGLGGLSLKQRGRTFFGTDPELNGEIRFKDMLRVNGHIAGSVCSPKGTLIVDTTAQIDADVEVAIAVVGGTVNGDIVAHQRVELGPTGKIYGNIWTRSLAVQNGAIFEGVCQMLTDKNDGN